MIKEIGSYFKSYPCPIRKRDLSNWALLSFSTPENSNYCIESKDYYRRDNFKLLEKLNKTELKKKGLLSNIPFNVCV